MLPDDVFRDHLEQTLIEIEAHIPKTRECANVEITAAPHYWRIAVMPFFPGTCPIDLIIKSDQKFSIKVDGRKFEDLPIERFDLFLKMLRAVEAGHVEKISKFNALTEELVATAMHISLAPKPDWIGEHRRLPPTAAEEWRTHRYLPYRRHAA